MTAVALSPEFDRLMRPHQVEPTADTAHAASDEDATRVIPPPPTAGFVPQSDEDMADMLRSMTALRDEESDSRLGLKAVLCGAAAVIGVLAAFCWHQQTIIANRPLPHDRVFASIVRQDGTVISQKFTEDLSASEREAVITSFLYDYVHWRLEYTWQGVGGNFNRVLVTTLPEERKAYADYMKASPDRPDQVMGIVGSAVIDEPDFSLRRDGPFAFVGFATRHVTLNNGQKHDERVRFAVTYAEVPSMPAEIAAKLDPGRIMVAKMIVAPSVFDPNNLKLTGVMQ